MRCNPSYWLWGLVPIALLSWLAVQLEHEGIEGDLGRRAQESLSRKGLDWAVVNFSGRDGSVAGKAVEDTDPARAISSVAETWGVRIVDGRTELLQVVEKYVWSATSQAGRVDLNGYVPSEDARKAILNAAHKEFPKAQITDEMKLARGAPDRALWQSGIGFGLKQLAQLKKGSVELDALNLTAVGEAATSPAYRTVKAALATAMPRGVKLALEKITPPLANPYVWSAKAQGNQVVMTGFVPDDKFRDEALGHAKKTFAKTTVVDRTEVADGATEGFGKAVVTVLDQLALLKTGSADISGKDIVFSGEAADENIANAIRKSLRMDIPQVFKVTEQIKYPKMTGPYLMSIARDGKTIELTGFVPNEAAHAALIDAVKARFPGAAITDKLQVASGAPENWQQCIVSGLSALPKLKTGKTVLTDRRLNVTGTTDDYAVSQTVPVDVKASAGQICETTVDIQFTGEAKALTWRAIRGGDSALALEGEVPDEATRAKLLEATRALFQGAQVTDQMQIVPGPADPWDKVALRGLDQLARLKRGEALLNGRDLTVKGVAETDPIAAEVRAAVLKGLPQGFSGHDEIEVAKKIEVIQEADRCQELLSETASTGTIQFSRANANITADSTNTLSVLADIANACPAFHIEIAGHTDSEGTDERNQKLSNRRAQAVSQYLTKVGVDANRLTAVGYGSSKPIADNASAEGRAKNRRIEFTVKVN